MKVIQILLVAVLLPGLTFAYQVVLKNGKIVEGTLVREDDSSIFIESDGVQMNFKKETLDLEKMAELNSASKSTAGPATAGTKSKPVATQPSSAKKPVRVFTDQDLAAMKEVWDGPTQTAPAASGPPADAAAADQTQTAPLEEPAARDEKIIRAEIAAKKEEIAELEKRIAGLKSRGGVTATWDKLLDSAKAELAALKDELKSATGKKSN